MSDIVMPRLSDSMEEGTVVRWLKQPGETVVRGEPIVEIETDKATITYESDVEGVLVQILVGEGQTVSVGTQIAHLRDGGEALTPEPQLQPPAPDQALPPLPTPSPLPTPQETGEFQLDNPTGQPTAERHAIDPALQPPPPTTADFGAVDFDPESVAFAHEEAPAAAHVDDGDVHGRVKASPIARRLARKLGVNLDQVEGTGPGGRIVKEDVEAAAGAAAAPQAQGPPIHAPATEEPVFTPYQKEEQFVQQPPAPLPTEFGTTGEHEQYTGEQPAIAPLPVSPPPLPVPPPLQAPPQQAPQQAPQQTPVQPFPPQQYPPQVPPQAYPQPQPYPPQAYPPQPPQPPQQPFPGPPPFVSGMTGNYPAIPGPRQQAPPQQAQPAGGTATRGQSTPSQLTSAQQTVARRMAESKATAPEFFVETDIDMTNAVSYREQLRGAISPLPSFNDFVIKASAQALRQYPKVNGAYKDGHFEQYGDVNIGVVVSSEDLLAVPTLFNVDQKGLAQIARESHELADAVRSRTIQPAQLSGGTFSVSNLGMYGVDRFTAILNPPQAAILAVGAINREAVIAEDGMSLVVRQIMTVTLTCDHRILYGAEAAEFLGAIKAWLESPQLLQV